MKAAPTLALALAFAATIAAGQGTSAADIHFYENGRKVALTEDGNDELGRPTFLRGPLNPQIDRRRQQRTLTRRFAAELHPQEDPQVVARQWGVRHVRRMPSRQRAFHIFEADTEMKALQLANAAFERGRVRAAQPMVRRQRALRIAFTDPLFPDQWHLKNTGQSWGDPGEDVNVEPAWDAGFLGTGVVIAIVDNGLEHTHPDLSPHYRADLSWDFNDDEADPSPNIGGLCDIGGEDCHGTSVAGVAAAGDNGIGVVGAAPRAGLAGLRLVAAPTTDEQEADALSHMPHGIVIYNNSWGPSDDALRLEGPGMLTQAAIVDGVTTGRNGKGVIYVWAAGNGLLRGDNSNYDGFANSRYTIAVSASDHDGVQSWYSEPGASILINAPSSGGAAITTTDLQAGAGYDDNRDWYDNFGGTSSSAPLAAGCIGLILEANPDLTWRDIQHILVHTATKNDAMDPEWTPNGAGHLVNHMYGFGRVDADAAVRAALTWTNVQEEVFASLQETAGAAIPDNDPGGVTRILTVPDSIQIEAVEVAVDITHANRGNLRIALTSPSGTESVLAEPHADSQEHFVWTLTTVRCWDELSQGNWMLTVSDEAGGDAGTLNGWELRLYGTQPACGNGVCDEPCDQCPEECSPCCGDGTCDPDETCGTCSDCSPCCGDGICNEPCASCPDDCSPCCGDGTCDPAEGCNDTCPEDCTGDLDCNENGIRDGCEVFGPGEREAQDVCAYAEAVCPGDHIGSTTTATLEDDQVTCSWRGHPSGPDVWYRYFPADDGSATVSTCDAADFDTQIAIHAADACPGDELYCVEDTTGCSGYTGEVTFPVAAGTEYLIRVTGYNGETGSFTMTLTGPPCMTAEDCDSNAVPDACDPDSDGDGAIDACDDCPADPGATTSPCCGDGRCDPAEDCEACPADCGACQPRLLQICEGLGADGDPTAFVSPKSRYVGFHTVDVLLTEDVTQIDSCTESTGGTPPLVDSLTQLGGGLHLVQFNGPIELAEWTTVELTVLGATSGVQGVVCFQISHLPGDLDGNGQVSVADATRFGDLFPGGATKLADLDGNGQVNINDATKFGQIWQGMASEGLDGTRGWQGEDLPSRPLCECP